MLRQLIANAPDRHTGGVPVPLHKALQLRHSLLLEELAEIIEILGHIPGVEGLVKYQHSQPVAGLQHFAGHRIVGKAQGIEAVLLVELYLAVFTVIERPLLSKT